MKTFRTACITGLYSFFILLGVSGCAGESYLDFALAQAGANRAGLQRVLDHYSDDPQKHEAAVFLIENMPWRYSLTGKEIDNLHAFYEAASRSGSTPRAVNDSLEALGLRFTPSRLRMEKDAETIGYDFLTDHIDAAFSVWRGTPWGRSVDFDTFCRHILPYRVGNERPRPWMRGMHARFIHLLDSIRATPDSADVVKVAEALVAGLQKIPRHYGHGLPTGVTIGADNVEWFAGDCREFTDILTFIMRSVGLPGGCDKMPMTGNYFLPHFWNYVVDGDGNTFYGSILFKTPEFKPAAAYNGPKGKVMREAFGLNRGLRDEVLGSAAADAVAPAFRFFIEEDVTPSYSGDSILDVRIPLARCYDRPRKGETAYMCLSSRLDWSPVDFAWPEGDSVTLRNVDGDVVMRLAVYRDGKLQPISNPFHISKKTGEIRFYEPSGEREEICLFYKFDDIFRERFSDLMTGGVFEGSDDAGFRKRDTLAVIASAPKRLYSGVRSGSSRPYRYVRYYGPENGKCYASEVTFLGHRPGSRETVRLEGECIGTPNLHSENKYPYTNVVDGDPYTSFVYEKLSGGWVGLALPQPMAVDSIVYTPRNRRNFIEAGDEYELFYCDREWRSLGRVTAESDSLLFNAPKGALLYLRNHSRGNQERIFEYSQGRQIFW